MDKQFELAMNNLIEDGNRIKLGKGDEIKKEVIVCTMEARESSLFRFILAATPKEEKLDVIKCILTHGLMTISMKVIGDIASKNKSRNFTSPF